MEVLGDGDGDWDRGLDPCVLVGMWFVTFFWVGFAKAGLAPWGRVMVVMVERGVVVAGMVWVRRSSITRMGNFGLRGIGLGLEWKWSGWKMVEGKEEEGGDDALRTFI